MNDQGFEKWLERLLSHSFSEGTDEFCEALLERCIESLGTDEEVEKLSDETLELLAAAGDVTAAFGRGSFGADNGV